MIIFIRFMNCVLCVVLCLFFLVNGIVYDVILVYKFLVIEIGERYYLE